MKPQLTDVYGLIGEDGIKKISEAFYKRVYEDEEEAWFKDMFASRAPYELAVFSQVTFLVQRLGGPEMYGGMEKDDGFVLQVHTFFQVTPLGLRRWMYHMRGAVEETVPNGPTIPQAAEIRSLLLDWFWEFGSKMINSVQNEGSARKEWNGMKKMKKERHEVENAEKNEQQNKEEEVVGDQNNSSEKKKSKDDERGERRKNMEGNRNVKRVQQEGEKIAKADKKKSNTTTKKKNEKNIEKTEVKKGEREGKGERKEKNKKTKERKKEDKRGEKKERKNEEKREDKKEEKKEEKKEVKKEEMKEVKKEEMKKDKKEEKKEEMKKENKEEKG